MSDQARLEDLAWMAECGVGMDEAARRLGITEGALDIWLARRQQQDLRARLLRQNPRDHNLTTVTIGRRSNRTNLNLQEI